MRRVTSMVSALVVVFLSAAEPAPARAALLANDDSYSTPYETRLRVDAPGFLANDIDVIGKPTLVATTTHGTLNWHDDGRIDYRPDVGFSGTDHFDYQVTVLLIHSTARVTIAVGPAPTPTPTPTPTPASTLTPPTPTPAATPTPTPTPTPRSSLLPPLTTPRPTATPTRPPGATEPPATSSPTSRPSDGASVGVTPSPDRSTAPGGGAGPIVPTTTAPGPPDSTSGGAGTVEAPPEPLIIGPPGGRVDVGDLDVGGMGLAVEWLVPTLLVTAPGLLVIFAILAQGAGAMLWLPYVRRTLGGDRRRQRSRSATP
jgi:Bacterial Ig domain